MLCFSNLLVRLLIFIFLITSFKKDTFKVLFKKRAYWQKTFGGGRWTPAPCSRGSEISNTNHMHIDVYSFELHEEHVDKWELETCKRVRHAREVPTKVKNNLKWSKTSKTDIKLSKMTCTHLKQPKITNVKMFQCFLREVVYVTIGNPTFCLALYLTGIQFRDKLQHVDWAKNQVLTNQTRETAGVRL